MTVLIFGIGVGLFILLSLWLSVGLICLISLRTEKKVGTIAIAIAGIVTIILISIPRASENPSVHEDEPYDQLFIWRIILIILLATSSIIGFVAYIKFELMEPMKPVQITNWIF